MNDLKKEAARTAITIIKQNSIVGLGGGATIHHMVNFLAEAVKDGLQVKLLTSSFTTGQLLLQQGFFVHDIQAFSAIDFYFDGCDQFDNNLHALKSGGGIHTTEKLLASMADQFILVGDETKYAANLQVKFPLVIEVLPSALKYILARLAQAYPDASVELRRTNQYDGPVITSNGNYLLDATFTVWPDLKTLHKKIKLMTGVVETSLFYGLAHKAIIGTATGVQIMEKIPG